MTASRRSDLVRAKRLKRAKPSEKRRPKRRKSRAQKLPPMVTRRGVSRPPSGAHNRKEARRMYNIALKTKGAELRLPPVPQMHFSWRLISGIFSAALGWAILILITSANFQINSVETIGLERIQNSEVNQVLKLSGVSIFTVDPAALQDILVKDFPGLKDIQISISMPTRVQVTAVERKPVLAWQQDQNDMWIDLNGVSFVPSGETPEMVNVLATGTPPGPVQPDSEHHFISPEFVQAILLLDQQAPKNTELLFDPRFGMGWVDPEKGWSAYFGMDGKDMDQRLIMYKAIVKELKKRKIKPTFISVQYLHAPYYRTD